MDVYRRGGDSLQGRYHHYRLHPFSYAEVLTPSAQHALAPEQELPIPTRGSQDILAALMQFGGFPEPFLSQSARTQRRWQKERFDRFFREDVRDLETIRDLSSIELLADMVSERVASPLSLNSLREDLEVSHRAITSWVDILDRLYYVFLVRPYASTAVKSLRKMPKTYLWDSSSVPAPGPRFENLVALHLLKLCHYLQDREGFRADLHYLRDRVGREVDFLVTVDRKPWFAVEAKVRATEIDPALIYFRERLRIPYSYQVVLESNRDYLQEGVRCLPARLFLAALL
jgi:predicted AAA+ superfamily ATPase